MGRESPEKPRFLGEFRVGAALLALITAGPLLVACGASGNQPSGETDLPPSGDTHNETGVPVVHVSTRWISDNAADLSSLTRSVDVVFVGLVAEFTGERFESAIQPTPLTSGRVSNEFPISQFAVEVEKPIVGDLGTGSTATLEQEGGLSANSDGTQVRIVLSGDEPLSVGRRYLFFASRKANGAFTSAPFERFSVGDGGKLASVPGWNHLPAVKQLSEIDVDRATSEIAAAGH